MRLENKVTIITGAGSGIGKETAILFAKEGARVVVADINEKTGEEVATTIRALGADAFFIKVDVSNTEQANNMVAQTMKKYGRVDVLVNNGGIVKDAFLTNITDEQIDNVIAVNQKGPLKCARAVAQIM
ncbi:SDR family NAD(P)-dependent oxidoreductase, partial [Patescibacteria group bacterium]|nr:SDR family NAD(P)-dependent oxidoreductase [Patescibacteria group bacterium]